MLISAMDPILEIKDKLNIVDIISPYVNLRKRGSNWFGLCPFHNEKTGSFSVNEDRGYFHCFGCSESGDMFTFVEKIEHIDFKEALEILAKKANVDISNKDVDRNYLDKKNKIFEINDIAQKFFTWILQTSKAGETGRKYLKKRNIKDISVKEYKLGYAPQSDDTLYKILVKKGYSDSEIIESGVCIIRERDKKIIDKFRGRLMFPIENISQKVVGFSGRHIPTANDVKFTPPKYLNTADTKIFNKGKILYGFNQAKEEAIKRGYIILSEGQVNIISSYQVSEKNIVASMGTALTLDHLKLISRYTKNIYFCFDNDNAGKNALYRGIKMALQNDFSIRVITLRDGNDPDEEIQKDSKLWKADIESAKDAIDYLIDFYKLGYKNIDDKNKIIQNFIEFYSSCINPITKEILIQKLSEAFNISPDTLIEYFSQKAPIEESKTVYTTPSTSLSSKDNEEFTLALLCQNYEVLHEYLLFDYSEYFIKYRELYDQLLDNSLDDLLKDNSSKDMIESLLTKNLPNFDDVTIAYLDCIKNLQISFVKNNVGVLKQKLQNSNEEEQETILKEIDTLIKSIS